MYIVFMYIQVIHMNYHKEKIQVPVHGALVLVLDYYSLQKNLIQQHI